MKKQVAIRVAARKLRQANKLAWDAFNLKRNNFGVTGITSKMWRDADELVHEARVLCWYHPQWYRKACNRVFLHGKRHGWSNKWYDLNDIEAFMQRLIDRGEIEA